ncbi:MAG: FlgD immunoglobulin-like domain containing protein [Bacteroidota bacterium]
MSYYRTMLFSFVALSLVFHSTLLTQEQSAQRTAAIRDELRQQYQPGDVVERKKESGQVVPSLGGSDVLVNNNTGSVGTGNFTQSETTILALGNAVVIGFNDAGSYNGSNNQFTGFSYSTNGGVSFTDGGTLPASVVGDAGDPVLAGNETTGRMYLSTLGFSGASTIQMFRSDNNGATWMAPVNATPGGGDEDKQWHAVDNFAGTGNGNVYLISRNFGSGNGIYVYRSTDHGATFGPSAGVQIVSGKQGAFIAVAPDHSVYAFWYDGTSIKVRKSTDFGVSFASEVIVASGLVGGVNGDLGLTGIRQGTASASSFRSSEFPHAAINPITGNIYVTYNNDGAGADRADVFLVQSTNGGTTWSSPVKVNDDATTTDQWQPTIAVTPSGSTIGIFYYSRQEDAVDNNLFKYYGRTGSISGSTITFTPSFPVSDVASLPEFGRDAVINTVYMGDYNHVSATASAFHVVWSDNRDDLSGGSPRKDPNVYYKSIATADPSDPNAPTSVTAYSQFSTPTTIQLNWTNPTTLVNGSPIGSFVMRIKRDGVQITEVTPPTATYNDGGRTTYQEYTYTLETRLTSNDSLSSPIQVSWIAGGSPIPSPPSGVGINITAPRSTQATISWTNPTTQDDGTPIHNFTGTQIWRNGVLLDSVNAATTSYVDTPPQGFVYTYYLRAYNNLVPKRYSDPSASVGGYVGDIPDVLVWQPADAISPSGDSLAASLGRLGISNFKVDSLFEFGSNLSQYDAIFVVVGIYDDNHVILASDLEGPALNTYVQNGGRLYLEGGDVFNYDPESASGYQVRPIFGLNDGVDGSGDVTSINGRTVFNGLTFSYAGGNNFMDELHPNSDGAGRTLWVAPGSTPVNDTMGVFHFYGLGRSVASVVEFGGLVNAGANLKDSVLAKIMTFFDQSLADPEILISPSSLADTLQSNQTSSLNLTINNTTSPPANGLIVGLSESAAWLSVTPAADTIGASSSGSFSVDFDATGLTPGTYTTNIIVTSNDPNEPSTNVGVSLVVTGAPNLVAVPTSIFKTMAPNTTSVDTLVIKNTGAAVLNWSIADLPFAPRSSDVQPSMMSWDELYPAKVGRDGRPIALTKDEKDPRSGQPPTEGQGGPDAGGYRWIDSDEAGGPTFNWVDITGIGTSIPSSQWISSGGTANADDGRTVIPLPFSFPYYSVNYDSLKLVTNGWMSFATTSTLTSYINEGIPTTSPSAPNNALYPWWDDHDLRTAGTVHYYNDVANSRFIVQYTNVPHYGTTQPGLYTYQVMLYANGAILFQYLDMQQTLNSATIGIENVDGTTGLQVVFSAAYMHNNLAILFGKDVSWLSENPTSGSVNPGDSAKVAIAFDASGLTEAVYTATLEIVSNDFANTPLHIPVELTVGANSVGVPLDAGWNIVSNPIVTANDSVLDLYPTAAFPYAFAYSPGTGYSQESRLQNGKGYWEKFPAGLTQTITGTQLTADTIPVVAGWNLIGALFSAVDTATITSTPPGIRQSPFFGFSGGYTADNTLEPGKGYWVKSSGTGSFIVTAPANNAPLSKAVSSTTDAWETFSSVKVSDNSGGSQVLYLGNTSAQDAVAYELPPAGPVGVLDARFESQRMVEYIDMRINQRVSYPIAIRSTAYPLTIKWNVNGGTALSLRDGITGSLIPSKTISGTGEIVITNPSINRLVISAEPTGIPTEFSLDQNYPNPFNPTTRIEYGLAAPAQVTLKVFDILGQEVVTLADGLQDAGYFAVEWDGRNASGNMVSSGVYFYRIEAAGTEAGATFRSLKKMTLMK